MNTKLDSIRLQLENSLQDLADLEKKRIRAEGQYETAMENLKELGFSTIADAASYYKKQQATLEEDIEAIIKSSAEFKEEFNRVFGAIANGK